MAMSTIEKTLMRMTPEQRKKTVEEISEMMGMPPLPKERVEELKRMLDTPSLPKERRESIKSVLKNDKRTRAILSRRQKNMG